MKLATPTMLNLFFLLGFFVLLLVLMSRERKHRLCRFVHKSLLSDVAFSFSRKSHVVKDIFLVGVFFFAIFALACPQWGYEWQDVHRQGIDIFIAIDTSRSMLTEDVRPNRLERTKLAVRDLLKKLNGDRVGLIPFSGTAFLSCPLTADYSGVLLALEDISVGTIPRGGTDIARAIQVALQGYEDVPSRYKALVILTDGESWEGDPVYWAKTAAEKGLRIYTIGIGTREGDLVKLVTDKGESDFLKDESGNFIKSRLNEGLLKDIAATAGGAYVRSSGAELGLDYIYDNQLSHLEKRNIESHLEKHYHDRFQWPLAVAIVFLLLETGVSLRRRKSDD